MARQTPRLNEDVFPMKLSHNVIIEKTLKNYDPSCDICNKKIIGYKVRVGYNVSVDTWRPYNLHLNCLLKGKVFTSKTKYSDDLICIYCGEKIENLDCIWFNKNKFSTEEYYLCIKSHVLCHTNAIKLFDKNNKIKNILVIESL